MAEDSIYVIGPKAVFDAKYEEYKANGFNNRGAVQYSVDGTKVLVEESPDKFQQTELDQAEFIGTQSEVKAYLQQHESEWVEELEEDML